MIDAKVVSLQDDDTIEITLKNGMICLLDAADWDLVKDIRWHPVCNSKTSSANWYVRGQLLPDESGKRRWIFLHRFLCQAPRAVLIDHINGDGMDNRRANLRFSNSSVNQANRKKGKPASSIYKGVYRRCGRFAACIRVNDKGIALGMFDDEALAALAYDAAAIEHFGDFARTNFPRPVVNLALAALAEKAK